MPTKRNYGGEQQNYVPKGNEAGGHMIKNPNYWNDGGKNQATEAFAQLFSAKSSSNPERYKLLKKYIPNTCKAFDEIYQKMKGIK